MLILPSTNFVPKVTRRKSGHWDAAITQGEGFIVLEGSGSPNIDALRARVYFAMQARGLRAITRSGSVNGRDGLYFRVR